VITLSSETESVLPVNTSKYNWFFRYKLHHIPFWFAYHLMWWTVTIGSISAVANSILYSAYSIKFLFYVVFQAIAVYFNLYYLMPRFLERGKYVQYISAVVLTIILTAAFIASGYYVSAGLSEKTFEELYHSNPHNYLYFFQINTLPSSVASMTLGMSVKLARNWIQTKRREQILEKENLETELKFLRSQFNPHFLFNSINSIFVLIHKNPDMASDSLAKFSDLLRYQLYECNEQEIPLDKELTYLENFIELEKLRQEHFIETNINIDKGPSGNLIIAPFLLMPFIENAFKHVSRQNNKPNWINVNLHFNQQELQLDVSNSIAAMEDQSSELINFGGIGLKNVQRRLDLMYPGEHKLVVEKNDEEFRVRLLLNLRGTKLSEFKAVPGHEPVLILNQA
jgi:two-component system LytT family sensor kinase